MAGDDDWFLASIDAIGSAGTSVRDAVAATLADLADCRRQYVEGVELLALVERLIGEASQVTRARMRGATEQLAHEMMLFRGELVRALVDDGGLSVAEVSQRMGVSRQMATRLLRVARLADQV